MKRLAYIYCAAPLGLALNNVPRLLGQPWQSAAAAALAVGLWAVVWMRLYTNRRLRPEFSLLAVLPQLAFYTLSYLQETLPEAAEAFATPFWSNLYFFMWVGVCIVGVCALLPQPQEKAQQPHRDVLFLLMSILTLAFCIAAWAGSTVLLFPLS